MNDDFKTKILIEKSKQENKANSFFKYLVVLVLIIIIVSIFLIFKENFLNYFFKSSSANKDREVLEEVIKETNTKEKKIELHNNNKQIALKIDVTKECKKYDLVDSLCNIKNLFQIALKKFNEESMKMLSNESINKIYSDEIDKILELKKNSLKFFKSNFYDKAYIEIIEAKKIFNFIEGLSEKTFKNNMILANKAYLNRNKKEAISFINIAGTYFPDNSNMINLKERINNIDQIIQLEDEIQSANINKNIMLEMNKIIKIKKLDKLITKYNNRLIELKFLEKEIEFKKLVSEAQDLIKLKKLSLAKNKINLAEKIFPKKKIIVILKEEIIKLEVLDKIALLKIEINNFILSDEWNTVEQKYKNILQLDNTNNYAVEGLKIAKSINSISSSINKYNKEPLLLTNNDNLNNAMLLMDKADIFIGDSSNLSRNVSLLKSNIKLANEPTIVNIMSDKNTNIILRKVGIIGKVSLKTLKLKAGKYVFEGKRVGYKTILVKVSIPLEEKSLNLKIICDEPI